MLKPLTALLLTSLTACEESTPETKTHTYEEWHSDYMNSRQNDSEDDMCSEYYQDCVDAGYPEESCSIRLEECEEYYEREESEREDDDDNEEDSECEEAGEAAMEECQNNGGTNEECRRAYADAYDDCMNNR